MRHHPTLFIDRPSHCLLEGRCKFKLGDVMARPESISEKVWDSGNTAPYVEAMSVKLISNDIVLYTPVILSKRG